MTRGQFVILVLLISECVVAQTKVYVCWDNRAIPAVKSDFFQQLFRSELPFAQNQIEIDLRHIVPPPEVRIDDQTTTDKPAVKPLPPLRFGFPRQCQTADIDSKGNLSLH